MAQRVEILLTDDLDGQQATQTVRFALDGRDLEIDLSDQNAAKLRMVFLPYISAGRRQGARPTSGADAGHELADVRAWARANGYEVSERGRVKQRVLDAYHAARAERVSSKLT
jgi:hypothetical protein